VIPTVPRLPIAVTPEDRDEWILAEGPTFGLVELRVVFDTGTGGDGEHAGLTALAWEMSARGTSTLDRGDFAEAMEHLGAEYSLGVRRDAAIVTLRVLEELLEPALDLLGDALTDALDDPDELADLLEETEESIQVALEEPDGLSARVTPGTLWDGAPWSFPADGHASTRDGIDVARVTARRRAVLSAPAWFCVGAEDPERAAKAVRRFRQRIRAYAPIGSPGPVTPPRAWGRARLIPFDAAQGVLTVFSEGPAPTSDIWPALALHTTLFGEGFTSPLVGAVRAREGLSYDVGWWISPERGTSLHIFRCHPEAAKVPRTLAVADAVWESMAAARPDVEALDRAKATYVGARLTALETVERRLAAAALARQLGEPVSRLWELPAAVTTLDAEAVSAASAAIGWSRRERSVVAVTPAEADAPEWAGALDGLDAQVVAPDDIE
jgi:predicted Zn-dependent peptidase